MSVVIARDGSKTAAPNFMRGDQMICTHCNTVMEDIEQGYGVWYHPKTGRCPNDDVSVGHRSLKHNRWVQPKRRKQLRRATTRGAKLAKKMRP